MTYVMYVKQIGTAIQVKRVSSPLKSFDVPGSIDTFAQSINRRPVAGSYYEATVLIMGLCESPGPAARRSRRLRHA